MATKKTATKAKTKAKAKAKAAPKTKAKAKAAPKSKAKAKTKVKARVKAAPKTKAKAKTKVKAKAKAAPKTKAKAKTKVKAKTKAKTKAKAAPKTKAKAKAQPKTKAKPKAKARQATKPRTTSATKPKEVHMQPEGNFVPYQPKRGEDYMNDSQREHFKKILQNWRNELMEEVDRTVHHMQDEAANPPDPADRATLEEEFSIELRTRDRERRLIKKIDSTIEMIANDEYGWCDSCGVEIGIRRLEARPTANKCIDCKTLDEIKEKQLGA